MKQSGKLGETSIWNSFEMRSLCEAFRNKKVLVTGINGFKGSWLCTWLKILGANVSGYSLNPPSDVSMWELIGIQKDIQFIYGDIRNLNQLSRIITDFSPDFVFHLAAQPLVRKSYSEPIVTFSTNVMGTVNILESIRLNNKPCVFINVTSDKCYENSEWVWGYREMDPMGGHDPYSCSKGCSELVTSSYRRSFFSSGSFNIHQVAVASARAGNVIGGGDFATDRLIPDLVKAYEQKKTLYIRSPNSIRPWQHVLEPLSGYLQLAARMQNEGVKFCGSWNFGPSDDDTKTVGHVVEVFSRFLNDELNWQANDSHQPHEAKLLKLDCSKARHILNWKPKLDLHTALEWTAQWYTQYINNPGALRQLTEKQIANYSELL